MLPTGLPLTTVAGSCISRSPRCRPMSSGGVEAVAMNELAGTTAAVPTGLYFGSFFSAVPAK